jgi:UDP-N-acetylmuramoyl-tripeptide--D-alanyl-D-alanine ligase
VALRSDRRDGHDFLGDAAARGAPAALVSAIRPGAPLPALVVGDTGAALLRLAAQHRQRFRGTVVGVTGSAGKTSTKELLSTLLGGAPRVLHTSGNLNNHLGVPLTLLRLELEFHTHAVIEAGLSRPGDIETLGPVIDADHAVITLVAPAHLEGMGTLEAIAHEKAALLRRGRGGGWAVIAGSAARLGAGDGHGMRTVVVARCGEEVEATVRWRVDRAEGHVLLTLLEDGRAERRFVLPQVTDGQASNAALALTLTSRLGVEDALLASRLATWRPPAWRGEWHETPAGPLHLDCYNSNPASLADALAHFVHRAPPGLPRLFLVGSMGELGHGAPALHRAAGAGIPLRPQDRLIAVGEHAAELAAGALAGGATPTQVEAVAAAQDAVPLLKAFHGALFAKGSRRWKLENALAVSPHGLAAGLNGAEAGHA